MTSVQLVRLRPTSDSLWPPVHFRNAAGASLLERFLQWLSGAGQLHNLWVVGHSARDHKTLDELLISYGGTYRSIPPANELAAAREVLEISNADTLELLPLGLMLLPDGYLQKLRALHSGARTDLTDGRGVPANASALLLSRRLIDLIAILPRLREEPTLREAIRSLRKMPDVARDQLRDAPPLRQTALEFPAVYGVPAEELPRAVGFGTPDDLALTLDVMAQRSSCASDAAVLSLLRAFKAYRVEMLQRRHRYTLRRGRFVRDAQNGSRRPIRVLYVANYCAYSGAEETLVRMIAAFEPQEVDAHAIVAKSGLLSQRLTAARTSVTVLDHDFAEPSLPNVRRLEDCMKASRPDVIHLNAACGQAVLLAAARRGIPIVQHLRSVDIAALGDTVHSAGSLISVSRFLADTLRQHEVDASKVRVVYDGIDADLFHPDKIDRVEARRRFEIAPAAKVILMIARFAPNKRHEVLLNAFRQTLAAVPDALLVLVGEALGDVECFTRVRALVRELGLEDRVRILGFQADVRPIESAADIQVLCSEQEPLGTSILESMALGIPVVISDGGGLKEVITNGVTGYVVPAGNPDELASRIVDLLQNDGRRWDMGRHARSAIENSFTARHCARRMMKVYEEICHRDSAVDPVDDAGTVTVWARQPC